MNLIRQFSSRKPVTLLVSGALWLISVVLGALAVFALRELLIWGLALVIPQPTTKARLEAANVIDLAQQCGIVVFGMMGLVVLLFCTERFIRDAGQPSLLRTLARIIIAEAVIVLPTWWLLWR